jgi:hypothetical protein
MVSAVVHPSVGIFRSSRRDLSCSRIIPGIEMPGYCHHVALRRGQTSFATPRRLNGIKTPGCWRTATISPTGTADRTAHGFRLRCASARQVRRCQSFCFENPGRPFRLHRISARQARDSSFFTTNPALKCRAIVNRSFGTGKCPTGTAESHFHKYRSSYSMRCFFSNARNSS